MDTIRILIVDDHATVRRGLRSLLSSQPDLEVVGEAAEGNEALQLAVSLAPEIILLDILMPGMDGLALAGQLRHTAPDARIIVLTAFDNEDYVRRALQMGVYAYLLKSMPEEMLLDAIRQVHEYKRVLAPALLDDVLKQFQTLAQEHARRQAGLSDEEFHVLELVARGSTNQEIATEMFWSERTVKRKVEEIMERLGARNRAQAAAEAVKRGIL